MTGERKGTNELNDGLGREVDGGNLFPDNTGDDFAPEGNEDDLSGLKVDF